MKFITIALLILYSSFAFTQTCAYFKNETDQFTHMKHVATKATLFGSGITSMGQIYFVITNDLLSVQLTYGEAITMRTSIESDLTSELWLSLVDGSIMKLKPTEAFKGSAVYEKTCSFHPWYPITQEQIETLAKTPIKTIRINIVQSYIEKEVVEKCQNQVTHAASCFLQALGDNVAPSGDTGSEVKDPHRPKDPLGGAVYDAIHKKDEHTQTRESVQSTPNPSSITTSPPPTTASTINTTTSTASLSVADELLKLKKLLDGRVLTQQEFDAQKKKLLDAK